MSVRPFAQAFEARFRQIEALLHVLPPPDGLRRALWDTTLDLRTRFPALQEVLGHSSPLPAASLAQSDIEAMRLERIALPTREPAALPEGHEPLGGARFAGFVEAAVGASMPAAFRLWCLQEARLTGDRSPLAPEDVAEIVDGDDRTLARFCHALVDHALGILPGPMVHLGEVGGFVWHPEGVLFAPAHLEEFAEGAARAMFAEAWASQTDECLAGLDILDAAPATPADALLEGYRFAGRFEAANGADVDELLEVARLADCGGDADLYARRAEMVGGLADAEEFGRTAALSACGHGVSWFDRHAAFALRTVRFDYAGPSRAGIAETPSGPRP